MFLHEFYRPGDGQKSREVAGSLHLVVIEESGIRRAGAVIAPADDQRVEEGLQFFFDIQEGRAFWGQHPFMASAGIDICLQAGKIQRDMAGGVSAVYDGDQAFLFCDRANFFDR